MIVECRPSSPCKWIVDWLTYKRIFNVIAGRNMVTGIYQHKEFNTYADAAGYHSSLIKRGINAQLRTKFNKD